MTKKLYTIAIAMFLALQLFAQDEWVVPADQKQQQNPLEYNIANVKRGEDLYMTNCKSCHGEPGKNNGLPLVPPPPDLTSPEMHENTDGDLFYKITKGRGGMPQFETMLSDDERWRIVAYINNFDPENEPLLVMAPPAKAKLLASVNEKEKKVEIFAEHQQDGAFVPLTNTPITVSTKKAFGNIEIGEVNTDKNGRAEFTIPETIIGDEKGLVQVVVSLEGNFESGQVTLQQAQVGIPKEVPILIHKEVLWSTNENIQIWLLLSYLVAVGGAWAAIGYVIFQIVKIKRLGKN